jgi:hypothetical protein
VHSCVLGWDFGDSLVRCGSEVVGNLIDIHVDSSTV